MSEKISITSMSIEDKEITCKFDIYNSMNDSTYIIDCLNQQNRRYALYIDRLNNKYRTGKMKGFDRDSFDFLRLHMFYKSVHSRFHVSDLISDKIALEIQQNVLTIKATSIDELEKITLLNKLKETTNLKSLCTLIQMTYDEIDVSFAYNKIRKAYDITDLITDYRVIVLLTEGNRVMVQLYHKDYVYPAEDTDAYRKYENALGPVLDATFVYLSLVI